MSVHHETLISNQKISENYYRLRFTWEGPVPLPGQFFSIRIADGPVPLLRRPLAFSGCLDSVAEAIYEIRGSGTRTLSTVKEGSPVDILGPVGNSFPVPQDGARPIIVGGGVGLGPVWYLAQTWKAHNPVFVAGFRTAGSAPHELGNDEFELVLTTDDGSVGFQGHPAAYIREHLLGEDRLEYYVCGPDPLMKAVVSLAAERGESSWVSLEQIMACSVGACMGCVVDTKTGFQRVCKDGPVFAGEVMPWT